MLNIKKKVHKYKIIIIILLLLISGLSFSFYNTYKNLNKCKERQKNLDQPASKVIDYLEIIQTDRIKSMNGFSDDNDQNREIIKNSIDFSFHYLLFNLFSNFIKELDKNKIDYFLIGGSLIGYFRHNEGFVPWDDDIDIGILDKDKEKVYKIIEEIHKVNNKYNL
jgi:hypothetical protein